jgi:hypothetical protein
VTFESGSRLSVIGDSAFRNCHFSLFINIQPGMERLMHNVR